MHRMRITQKGKKMNSKNQQKKKEIDWMITLVPLALIVALCIVFFFAPEQSNQVLGQIRFLFGDTFGTYYLVIGLGIFFLSLFLAGSKYGNIVLGKPDEKPKYSFFAWGCMMFTCGLAADILFIRSLSGFCTQQILTSQNLAAFRTGQAYFHCFTGALSRGDSIWYWPLRLALCFM